MWVWNLSPVTMATSGFFSRICIIFAAVFAGYVWSPSVIIMYFGCFVFCFRCCIAVFMAFPFPLLFCCITSVPRLRAISCVPSVDPPSTTSMWAFGKTFWYSFIVGLIPGASLSVGIIIVMFSFIFLPLFRWECRWCVGF